MIPKIVGPFSVAAARASATVRCPNGEVLHCQGKSDAYLFAACDRIDVIEADLALTIQERDERAAVVSALEIRLKAAEDDRDDFFRHYATAYEKWLNLSVTAAFYRAKREAAEAESATLREKLTAAETTCGAACSEQTPRCNRDLRGADSETKNGFDLDKALELARQNPGNPHSFIYLAALNVVEAAERALPVMSDHYGWGQGQSSCMTLLHFINEFARSAANEYGLSEADSKQKNPKVDP